LTILESLNVSSVSDITNEQFIGLANAHVAVPDLIILFIGMLMIFLIVGLIFVQKSRGTFFKIWILSATLGLFVLLFLCFCPIIVNSFIEGISILFN
jgi:hypothetical protein